ncbi:MAG: hypothetical protein K6C69_06230 [Lachnospiraceae bacterium]|nr:hypothetical protein [Lachnospiraceae bacterium]
MAKTIYLAGFLWSVMAIVFEIKRIHRKKDIIIQGWIWNFLVILLGMIIFTIWIYGIHMDTHDDYSHWALVVKRIYTMQAFPTASDSMIQFQSYPLGISVWDYYGCNMIGFSDWTMQWMQFLLNLSCFLPLFYCLGGNKRAWSPLLVLFSILMLNGNVPIIKSLSVDTMIALVGSLPVILLLERIRWKEYQDRRILASYMESKEAYWGIGILLAMNLMIKNSGWYFLILWSVFALWMLPESLVNRIKNILQVWILPILVTVFWKIYSYVNLPNSEMSNHAFSISRYGKILATRQGEDLSKFFYYFLGNSYGIECYYVCLLLLIIWILCYVMRKTTFARRLLQISVTTYITWMLALMAMYLCSMTDSEIDKVVSMDRYRRTMELFLYMIWTYYLVGYLSNHKMKDIFSKMKDIIPKMKDIFLKKCAAKDVQPLISHSILPLMFIGLISILVSLPKDWYDPWNIWHMNIDLRKNLEQGFRDGIIHSESNLVIYSENKFFLESGTTDGTKQQYSNEYYLAQYALNTNQFIVSNDLKEIDRLLHQGYVCFLAGYELENQVLLEKYPENCKGNWIFMVQ